MHGKRVGIVVRRQRYRCDHCHQPFLDPLQGVDEHHRMTVRLRSYLETQALSRPFSALAELSGFDEKTVRRVLGDAVKQWDKT